MIPFHHPRGIRQLLMCIAQAPLSQCSIVCWPPETTSGNHIRVRGACLPRLTDRPLNLGPDHHTEVSMIYLLRRESKGRIYQIPPRFTWEDSQTSWIPIQKEARLRVFILRVAFTVRILIEGFDKVVQYIWCGVDRGRRGHDKARAKDFNLCCSSSGSQWMRTRREGDRGRYRNPDYRNECG